VPEQVVFMNMKGEYYGPYMPSSEWRMHYDIYKSCPEAQAVVHAHSTYSTALSCLRIGIPAFHYMVAVAGGKKIGCAEYATFGTQDLSDNMVKALGARKSVLLANHGITCHGSDLDNALFMASETEHLAKQYVSALVEGTALKMLSRKEMNAVRKIFESASPLAANGLAAADGQQEDEPVKKKKKRCSFRQSDVVAQSCC